MYNPNQVSASVTKTKVAFRYRSQNTFFVIFVIFFCPIFKVFLMFSYFLCGISSEKLKIEHISIMVKKRIFYLAVNLILGTLLCKKKYPVLLYRKLSLFLRNVFLTRSIVHFGFRIRYRTKTKVLVSVIHYTVALYPILLKADASKKKYKQVFIYYLLGQQKSRLVELERCFEEAIGLHHGLCWLCEVFLQILS